MVLRNLTSQQSMLAKALIPSSTTPARRTLTLSQSSLLPSAMAALHEVASFVAIQAKETSYRFKCGMSALSQHSHFLPANWDCDRRHDVTVDDSSDSWPENKNVSGWQPEGTPAAPWPSKQRGEV
jgi:hypothetical protein